MICRLTTRDSMALSSTQPSSLFSSYLERLWLGEYIDLLGAVARPLPDVDAKPEPKISRREDGSFVIDATTPVGDVLARLGLKEPQEQRFVTVSGLVLSRLDHGPQPGRYHTMDGTLKFLEVDGTRIEKLLAFASKEQDQRVRMCRP
jgi:putative hemolysin